jgi:hypothetical protein
VLRIKVQDRKCKPGVVPEKKKKTLSNRPDSCTRIKKGEHNFLTGELANRPDEQLAQIESRTAGRNTPDLPQKQRGKWTTPMICKHEVFNSNPNKVYLGHRSLSLI